MPERKNSTNKGNTTTPRRSPRFIHQKIPSDSQEIPQSKSVNNRVSTNSNNPVSSSPSPFPGKIQEDYPEKVARNLNESNEGSKTHANSIIGLRRSSRLNGVVAGNQFPTRFSRFLNEGKRDERTNMINGLRRSPRLNQGKSDEPVGTNDGDKDGGFRKCSSRESSDKEVPWNVGKANVGAGSCENIARKRKRKRKLRSTYVDSENTVAEEENTENIEAEGENTVDDVDEGNGETMAKMVRKEESKGAGLVQDWTEEQEMALKRAYFAAKPTPHFWKRVAKLVPGKSAKDCFEKIHSDHLTPPQPQPRSRANKTRSLSPCYFSLSASKVLNPSFPKVRRPSCNKRNSHLVRKTLRSLLQSHYHMNQDSDADLFSVLEPTTNPHAFSQNVSLSTSENEPQMLGFHQTSHERSSSGHKKPFTTLGTLSGMPVVSPLVLKQVKNRALHDKYIDRLHCREAKRKAACMRAAKSLPEKDVSKERKTDAVRAAQNLLASDARDAIKLFQHKQANDMNNFSTFEDDGVGYDDDDEVVHED